MNDRLQEQLLGYALGALDDAEQREIEDRLSTDPALRRELESVQQSLEPLAEAYVEYDPPAGLAAQACEYVAEEALRLRQVQPGRAGAVGGFESRSRWAFADWVVTGGICVVAVALFFPAVLNSRFLSRVTVCQNNLRELGTSLSQYSEYLGDGFFPAASTEGNRAFAGIWRPILLDQGFLTDPSLALCPDSALAQNGVAIPAPNLQEIDAASGSRILLLQRFAGGSYAYTLGVILNGRHMPIRNMRRPHFAIMADSPWEPLGQQTHRHGRNILYEDQHISFVSDLSEVRLVDDPFFNHYGRCEASFDVNDAVLGPSDFPPVRTPSVSAYQLDKEAR